ncbi:hypothetical protein EHQ27_09940 [Leptospira wolffii]|uniref:hypothetical protein n=1 Tax=Leptospira wolffii TaxID=409998 RepID=UPI0010841B58|nr:hypothetical protein [Leptospira wolffii]TGK56812.1 hypothetical protein EHQ32_14590 [Leptospira wolffii]TGK71606.1 hypothetical protein EHQ27_09940 [Leptospira wolffii]TGK75537.1 hypothetical protein EHQ35_03965 [Leptospira wolffii]TGL32973.1 hypothetical protein EHQ57_00565 [Leptospira wolffii]
MSRFRNLKERILSQFSFLGFLGSVKWEAGKIRLQKKLDPYLTHRNVSEEIRPFDSQSPDFSPDWSKNLPPFSFTETEEEEILPNAKRKIRTFREHKVSLWSLLPFLFWRKKIEEADPLSRAFLPGQETRGENAPHSKRKSSSLRDRPYFWEAWFPQTSTLTLSPLLVWETSVSSDLFSDCLPESILPAGEPGKWKVRIHAMRVLSHQIGNLYEDRFPKPHLVHRAEVWVYGHEKEKEIDPEEARLFPLGVWLNPNFLKEEDPRLRAGLPFREGNISWNIRGEELQIGIRDRFWVWRPSSQKEDFPKELESPHIVLGKTYHCLESKEFNKDRAKAYLFKRAIVSDPSLLQRSKPARKRSGVSPNPILK